MRNSENITLNVPANTACSPAQADDARLMYLAGQGSHRAFGMLVERHSPGLKRYLHAGLHDSETEKDVLQEIWYELFKYVEEHRYTEKGNFLHLLRTISRHAVLREKENTRKFVYEIPEEADTSADEAMLNKEKRSLLTRFIYKMDKLTRIVMRLRVERNFPYCRIAVRVGKSEVHVRKIYSNGIAKLKSLMKSEIKNIF